MRGLYGARHTQRKKRPTTHRVLWDEPSADGCLLGALYVKSGSRVPSLPLWMIAPVRYCVAMLCVSRRSGGASNRAQPTSITCRSRCSVSVCRSAVSVSRPLRHACWTWRVASGAGPSSAGAGAGAAGGAGAAACSGEVTAVAEAVSGIGGGGEFMALCEVGG